MADTLVLSVEEAHIAFGQKVLFNDLTFHILERDRIALVGKNGTGKSTLMKLITADLDLDGGKRFHLEGTKIGYLAQDITPRAGQTVQDYVFEGLGADATKELVSYKVEQIVEPLHLTPTDLMTNLSGGQLRRAALARALVDQPDILLLDEPTNHLDLDVIEWLEQYLRSYQGALVCISHDKRFLATITNKVFWLDRGKLKVAPRGFGYFEEWSENLLEQEARELHNRTKYVEQEAEWASRGVKARRKRNQRRLETMKEMREQLKRDVSAYRRAIRKIEWEVPELDVSSKILAEFTRVDKSYGNKKILDSFSLKLLRGDRIGILGKNGSGKTTFLKMLVGELEPDKGTVKRARDLEFSYFDQARKDLKPELSLWRILCPNGGDHVVVMGKSRHVIGYLKEFLFDPDMAHQPVATLSGGQKNRLLLAKVLADPKTLMILDEPTNDLDTDTLELLEDVLNQFQGTLIVVSHDRDFLDQTVSKILAFEGNGVVEGYVGGYSDYLERREQKKLEENGGTLPTKAKPKAKNKPNVAEAVVEVETPKPKLEKVSFKLVHEWKTLPKTIEALEREIAALTDKLSDPEFYTQDKDGFFKVSQKLPRVKTELEEAEQRWLELDEKITAAGGA